MCDDEGRASRHEPIHGLLDAQLGARVHRGGGLVQNEHAAVGQKGPGNGDELALALAQVARVLVDLEVVAAGQHADEMVGAGLARGRLHFPIGGIKPPVADVLAHGAGEQPRILQHHGEQIPHIGAGKLADVGAADTDGARVHVVEAHEQLHHGGLAGARGADDGHGLPGGHASGEVADDGRIGRVAEAHAVEFHVGGKRRGIHGGSLFRHLGQIEEGEDALGRRGQGLQHVGDLGQLGDGLCEVLHVLDEGLDVAYRDSARHGEERAGDGDGHIPQIPYEPEHRHHEAREELRLPAGVVERLVVGLVGAHGLVLPPEGAHDGMARERLLHTAVQRAEQTLLGHEVLL